MFLISSCTVDMMTLSICTPCGRAAGQQNCVLLHVHHQRCLTFVDATTIVSTSPPSLTKARNWNASRVCPQHGISWYGYDFNTACEAKRPSHQDAVQVARAAQGVVAGTA